MEPQLDWREASAEGLRANSSRTPLSPNPWLSADSTAAKRRARQRVNPEVRIPAMQDHAVLCAQVSSSSSAGTSATAPMQTCQVIAPACDARHRSRFAHHSARLTHGLRLSNLSGTKLDRCCLTTQALALSQETSGSL